MNEDETCRICRTGAEEDVPLYHPCKCSGSIAKVHQDCLIEWLQHSKKKSCELCHTELRFHKVYAPTMPSKLPTHLYLRRFVLQLFQLFRMSLRALVVATAWLAVLPLGNIYIWRLHFWIVDVLVWGITGGQPPSPPSRAGMNADAISSAQSLNASIVANLALWNQSLAANAIPSSIGTRTNDSLAQHENGEGNTSVGIPFPLLPFEKLFLRLFAHTDVRKMFDALAHDTFEGQVLTCAVVVLFVALFLLREWCLQNLPQQVEELDPVRDPPAPLQMQGQRAEILFAAEPARQEELEVDDVDRLQPADDVLTDMIDRHADASSNSRVEHSSTAPISPPHEAEEDFMSDEPASLNDLRLRRTRWSAQNGFSEGADLSSQDSSGRNRVDRRRSWERTEGKQTDVRESDIFAVGDVRHTVGGAEKGKGRAVDEDDEKDNDKEHMTVIDGHEERTYGEHKLDGNSTGTGKQRAADLSDGHVGEVEDTEEQSLISSLDVRESSLARSDDLDRGSDISDPTPMSDETEKDDDMDDEDDEERGEQIVLADQRNIGRGRVAEDGALRDDQDLQAPDQGNANRDVDDHRPPVVNDEQPEVAGEGDGADLDGEWEDELENGERLEDDLEGMMEAIGMRGPLVNLITNMTMMFVLCSFILTIFIALPYTMGRVIGIGRYPVRIVLFPLRPLGAVFKQTFRPSAHRLRSFVHWALKRSLLSSSDEPLQPGVSFPSTLKRIFFHQHFHSWSKMQQGQASWESHSSSLYSIRIALSSLRTSFTAAFGLLFSHLKTALCEADRKTDAKTASDRAFCIALGHLYWLVGLAIQHKMSTLYIRWKLKALKAFVDQQLVVLKVLAFIVLELIVFPLCCGVLTDIALYPLWERASFTDRILLLQSKPLSMTFTLWSLGTLYMFALAQFVAHTRSIVRPGVLCFVRDAGDPNFHPIKDILERRSLEQLRKIGISGLIYSAILFVTVGFCVRLITWTTSGVFPLNWQVHRSASSVGFELVSIAILLPIAVKAWFPSHYVRRSTRKWWRWNARKLRLSSYMIGGRYQSEEGQFVYHSWLAWMQGQMINLGLMTASVNGGDVRSTHVLRVFRPSGSHGRVPADDHAIMTSPLIVRTDATGAPLDARGKEAIRAQEEAIAKLTKKPQYAIVYLPPNFRTRIVLLIISMWCSICALILLGLVPPLLVGRSALRIAGLSRRQMDDEREETLHDGYAWFFGYALLGASQTLAAKAQRMITKLRSSSNAPRRLLKHLRRFAQRCWLVFLFGFLTSLSLGVCVEVYVNALSRIVVGRAEMPSISILHAWSMGALEQQLVLEILRIRLGRTFRPTFEGRFAFFSGPFHALLELQNGGWRQPKAFTLTKFAFLPAVTLHLVAVVTPLAVLRLVRLLDNRSTDEARAVQVTLVFALCLTYICSGLISKTIARRMDSWTDVLKDEHFLISTELKNYDEIDLGSGENERDALDEDVGARREAGVRGQERDRFNAEGPIPDALLQQG